MPVIEIMRPLTLLLSNLGKISVAKKLLGYDKVIPPPTGKDDVVVNDRVTSTPLLEATRSLLAMVKITLPTCPPALVPALG